MDSTKLLEEALGDPSITEAYSRLLNDADTRVPFPRPIPVITLEPYEVDGDPGVLLPVPGAMTMFAGRPCDPWTKETRKAFERRDWDALRDLGDRSTRDLEQRKPRPYPELVRELVEAPTYSELRFGGKTLAQGIGFVDGVDYGSLSFPYSGAHIREELLQVVDYNQPGEHEAAEVFAVLRRPDLSEIEARILHALPESRVEMNLGGGEAAVTVTTIGIVLFVVAMHTPAFAGGHDRERFESLAGERMRKFESVQGLSVAASAAQLIRARRDLLAENRIR